jgi:hypothetical protein
MKHQNSNNLGRCLNHTWGRSENYGCKCQFSLVEGKNRLIIEISRKPEQDGIGDHDDDLPVDQYYP